MTQIFRAQNKENGVQGNSREDIVIVNVIRSSNASKPELCLRIRFVPHSKHSTSRL